MTMDVNLLPSLLDSGNQARSPNQSIGLDLESFSKTRDMPLITLGERGTPPRLAAAVALNPTTIILHWNMRMMANDASFLPYYAINALGGAVPRLISSVAFNNTFQSFSILTLDGPMSTGALFDYEIEVSPLMRELRGPAMDPGFLTIQVQSQLCSGLE